MNANEASLILAFLLKSIQPLHTKGYNLLLRIINLACLVKVCFK